MLLEENYTGGAELDLSKEDFNFSQTVLTLLDLPTDNIPSDKLPFLIDVLRLPVKSTWREVTFELSKIKRAIAFGLCRSFEDYCERGGVSEEDIYKEFDRLFEEKKKNK